MSKEPQPSVLDRLLRIFSDVKAGEGLTALLMLANLFVILTAYYVIKVAREPLILASGGAEMKSYASAGQAVVLLGFVPLYSYVAGQVDRMKLILGLTIFFVVCIELFFLGSTIGVPYLGIIFYVWVGIFSVSVIAQFWSYANDFYTRGQGERLFPIVAVGATVGSVVGSKLASYLFKTMELGAYVILQVSVGLLLINLVLYWLIAQRPQSDEAVAETAGEAAAEKPKGANGFLLVFNSPYLRLIAVLLIALNIVNTTGEYILATMIEDAAIAATGATEGDAFEAYVGAFYGDFFFYVNVAAVILQTFIVARIVQVFGIAGVLFALPIVAFGVYGLVAYGVALTSVRWAKTAENSTDYSIMNTAKAMLWLPTTSEEKYNAKQAIDTFFVRLGDVFAALIVFVGTTYLAFGVQQFAMLNLAITVVWVGLAWLVYQRYSALSVDTETKP